MIAMRYERGNTLVVTRVAGFAFYEGPDVFNNLEIGAKLELLAQPDNPYDANAVSVSFEGRRIGFIPRSDNRKVSKFLYFGHGDILEAVINRITPDAEPEHQVGIVIRIKDVREDPFLSDPESKKQIKIAITAKGDESDDSYEFEKEVCSSIIRRLMG